MIHETGIIGKNVQFGKIVFVGVYSLAEDGVEIGDHVEIRSHVGLRSESLIPGYSRNSDFFNEFWRKLTPQNRLFQKLRDFSSSQFPSG
jgi:acyl-[acyl carrier protein]--UDP-N-acetylglucosamine O-acyltransferase